MFPANVVQQGGLGAASTIVPQLATGRRPGMNPGGGSSLGRWCCFLLRIEDIPYRVYGYPIPSPNP